MRVEAPTLQDAISQAAQNLDCSVIDVEIEIIQKPSSAIYSYLSSNKKDTRFLLLPSYINFLNFCVCTLNF